MRNPLRTEAEAFSFVLVVAVCFLALALAAVLGGTWVAVAVFLSLALGATVGIYMKSDPPMHESAVWARRAPGERRRILVVANETLAGRALQEEVRHRAGSGAAEVLVVAPALNSHLRHWTSDEDGSRAEAARRLEASLAALGESGVEVRGTVGDADPIQAIEDALRTFHADEVLISTHPYGRSNWLEKNVVGSARERFPIPIAHVVVDLEHEQEQASEKSPAFGS